MARRTLGCVLAVALAAATLAAAASPGSPDDGGGIAADELTAMFQRYGDTSGTWLGADRTASVPLPDGRTLWLFSDTYLGSPGADGSRPRTSGLIHNSAIVQTGTELGPLRSGGTPERRASLVPTEPDDEFSWVGDAAVTGGTVQVLVNRYRRTGAGPLDHRLTGTGLATFELPGLALGTVRELPLGTTISWGSEVMPDGEWTYVYGTEAAGAMKFAHLARVHGTDLTHSWEFWTGSAWSTTESESARLLSGVGTNFGVRRVGGYYVLVTHENNLTFSADFVAYTATSPTGPFGGPHYLFSAPEVRAGHIVYDADLHLDLARKGRLLISYNVNDLDLAVTYADASIYRPRFVEVEWPPSGSSARRPPAPHGLTASADGAGTAGLTWQPVRGDGITYRIYRRDVTEAQTHFVRLPGEGPGPATSFRSDFLVNGHEYAFAVTAVAGRRESPLSATATMRATVPPPGAPTGVRAESGPDGRVTVHWQPIPYVQLFEVVVRDRTAEPSSAGTYPGLSATIGPLRNGHRYDITVVAVGGGGRSRPSQPVQITPTVAVPPAPGRPTAEAEADGSIQLTWQQVAPDIGYRIYRRDLTRDETRWGPPGLAMGTTFDTGPLTPAHEYEFAVAAVNDGGESPWSPTVTARADVAAGDEVPAGLKAEAGPGFGKLTWQSTGSAWYWLFRRDVTAGERQFVREEVPVEGTEATVHNLIDGHTYEFQVAAFRDGDTGPRSKAVTVRLAAPMPTLIVALSETAGAATVTWQENRSGLMYRIQLRDATAGEDWRTDPFPVYGNRFETARLTSGHRYEFRIVLPDESVSPVAAALVS
ncbi:fibronectin type III domain-containing protein [Actinoplanes sp. NPDC049681]|uniref:fibronectin type III domain-containing protein n=1 Tax=Actinoplanes sp. NPDC049681 TaxID=3363905 RepID=UPI0037A10E75